jgi:hypothetical protein
MKYLSLILFLMVITGHQISAQSSTILLDDVEKIVVGPHVRLILEPGNESVMRLDLNGVERDDIRIRTSGKTLKIFLAGSKFLPQKKSRTRYFEKQYGSYFAYDNQNEITARVTFETLKKIVVRGSEGVRCYAPFKADKLKLKVYGENKIHFASVEIDKLKVKSFGANKITIRDGSAQKQVYRLFGEHHISNRHLNSGVVKATSYGETTMNLQAQDKVKINAFGEVDINYSGGATLHKGILLGEHSFAHRR